MMETPKTGLHENIPAETYHGWTELMSNSLLGHLKRSPAHYVYARDNPPEPTPAMRLGQIIHRAVLEPDLYFDTVAVSPRVDRRTKAGKEAMEAFEQESAGMLIVSEEENLLCVAVHEAIMATDTARILIDKPGRTELTAIWEHEIGVSCRNRFDKVLAEGDLIIDLKTCMDASPVEFRRSVARYGYYRQAAFYLDGFAAATGRTPAGFVFLAVEKSPPYGVGIYCLNESGIDAGRIEYERLLADYARCLADDKWPCYPDEVQTLELPAWVEYDIERMMEAEHVD